MARYRKLDIRTWNDSKFRQLSPLPPSGQSLWLYLVVGPFTTNVPGLFEASEVAMADRLGWPLEAFRKAFEEASSKGMAKADWSARLVWLPNAPEYNRPESPNVVKSWGATFDELPECPLKWQAYQTLKAFVKGLGKTFPKAFDEAFPKPSPIQEQEQEQKQEQECVRGERTLELVAVKGRKGPDLPPESELHESFERIAAKYPSRTGRQNLIADEHAWRMRLEDGVPIADLEAGVERYAAFVRAKGVSGPQFVIAMSEFFGGADRPWAQAWTPPPSKSQQTEDANVEAGLAFLRRGES